MNQGTENPQAAEQAADLHQLADAAGPEADEYQPGPEPGGARRQLAADDPELADLLKTVYFIVFEGLGSRPGKAHWKLREGEAGELGEKTARVLVKYFPDVESGPEVALVITGIAVLGPRAMMDRMQAQQQQTETGAEDDGDTPTDEPR